jgi:hypothetical protein
LTATQPPNGNVLPEPLDEPLELQPCRASHRDKCDLFVGHAAKLASHDERHEQPGSRDCVLWREVPR